MSAAAVVLAAGKGTRFRSGTAKVLHPVLGRPLLGWVLEALRPLGLERIVVVVGHQAVEVEAAVKELDVPGTLCVEQHPQLGTGHAVRVGLEGAGLAGPDGPADVLVLPGDAPLLRSSSLAELLQRHQRGDAAVTALTTRLQDPSGYGRLLKDAAGRVTGIVEERDASAEQRLLDEVNTSVYAFRRGDLVQALGELSTDNAQGEEYLTDCIGILADHGVQTLQADPVEVAGVNDRAQLADAGAVLRRRVLRELMLDGVTVVDPATTYVQPGVDVAPDVTLLPGTHLEGATGIAAGATVGPDCRLIDTVVGEGATVTYSVVLGAVVGPGATVGPFAYLRPDATLHEGAKVGAFVEVKKSVVGAGSKVPHLSYVGDTTIGRDVNVGAGTVTVNYDGFHKHRTEIGDGAFVGSDTMLVAPVSVGRGAQTGAGSTITKDVPEDALAVERSDQRVVQGWAARRRAAHSQTD